MILGPKHPMLHIGAAGQSDQMRRGRIVNKTWGDENSQLRERHSAADFEGKVLEPSKPV